MQSHGWNEFAEESIKAAQANVPNSQAGRVRRSERDWDVVETTSGPVQCERRLGYFAPYIEPAVGDWVLVTEDKTQEPFQFVISSIAERRNEIARRRSNPGAIRKQSLATNIDTVAIVVGLCLLYTSPSPRDRQKSRMPSSA